MRISSGPRAGRALQMPSTTMTKSSTRRPTPLSAESLFELSWTHFIELIRLDDPWKRAFYENECLKGHWSVRQLQRQIERDRAAWEQRRRGPNDARDDRPKTRA